MTTNDKINKVWLSLLETPTFKRTMLQISISSIQKVYTTTPIITVLKILEVIENVKKVIMEIAYYFFNGKLFYKSVEAVLAVIIIRTLIVGIPNLRDRDLMVGTPNLNLPLPLDIDNQRPMPMIKVPGATAPVYKEPGYIYRTPCWLQILVCICGLFKKS